jgi:hypothetical protein
MLRNTPLLALRVTYAFISRAYETDASLCRDTFFSKELPEAQLRECVVRVRLNAAYAFHCCLCVFTSRLRVCLSGIAACSYMARIAANGKARLLDLRALGASLPVPPQRTPVAPVFVMGAAGDAIVDEARDALLLRRHRMCTLLACASFAEQVLRCCFHRRKGCARRLGNAAQMRRRCCCRAWATTSCWTRAGARRRMRWARGWTRCPPCEEGCVRRRCVSSCRRQRQCHMLHVAAPRRAEAYTQAAGICTLRAWPRQ